MTPKAVTGYTIVSDTLDKNLAREIWTGNYERVLPLSIQNFDLSAILPAVFYMFRWGHRRGRGRFVETYGTDGPSKKGSRQTVSIDQVADFLSNREETLDGFKGEAEKAILGDLLLCFCLENRNRALGRDDQILRSAPTHYMSSWIDLPESVAHLRYVPEMIVAMLANQKGDTIQHTDEKGKTWFPVGKRFTENVLLRVFDKGIRLEGEVVGNKSADSFDEETAVGIDQLLMIRLARQVGSAPDNVRGGEGDRISNQRPIAEKISSNFSEDIRRFLRAYAPSIPRQTLVSMLESCISIGLTTVLTGVINIMVEWAETGEVRKKAEQVPEPLFVDCSGGIDSRIRASAEQFFDDFLRRTDRFPVILMGARLLDWHCRHNKKLKNTDQKTRPYATDWLNLLGDVLHGRHDESQRIMYSIEEKASSLGDRLKDENPEASGILLDVSQQSNDLWRLAEGLSFLQGKKNIQGNQLKCLDSCLFIDRPNGLAVKRKSVTTNLGGGRRRREVRSIIFSDSVLDYLVHLHLLKNGQRHGLRSLSLQQFLKVLRGRYGFYIDTAPPGMVVSNQLLQSNRVFLEKRLRDLGLLSGVNDAESMKRLQTRYMPQGGNDDEID